MPSTTCPSCDGKGVAWYEVRVAAPGDWRGGYIDEAEMECRLCEGSGEVDEEVAESYDPFE